MIRLKTKMLFLTALLIFTIASNFGLAYTLTCHCQSSTGRVPYGALVKVYEIDPIPGGSFKIDEIVLNPIPTVDEYGNFTISTSSPNGSGGFEVGGPDLIFTLLQNINGSLETICQETPVETHWNASDNSSLSFQITSDLGIFYTPGSGAVPNNKLFLFTRVGSHAIADIDCKGNDPNSTGYYKARRPPYNCVGINSDMPYGSMLELFGWFGQMCNIDCYKVQYSTDGGNNWVDVNTNLPNKWYDTSSTNPFDWHWVSQSMGPFSSGGVANLYNIPYKVKPGVPWSYTDRVACFDSREAANGECIIQVIGYRIEGANVVPATEPHIFYDQNYGKIKLRLDNTPPIVQIIDLKLNGISHHPCDILQFGTNNSDIISLDFKAWDQQGHLGKYTLIAMYGHNESVYPYPYTPDKAVDNYGLQAAYPSWQGDMSYTTNYIENVYTPDKMPTCAYQFRLRASKRTTNGYGLIYDGIEDTWHVTIQR